MNDGHGSSVRSLDIFPKSYTYEDGRIIRAAESAITLNGEVIIGQTLVKRLAQRGCTSTQCTTPRTEQCARRCEMRISASTHSIFLKALSVQMRQ